MGKGKQMREWLRQQPGGKAVHTIYTPDNAALAIVIYRDEPTYRALVGGEDSPFERKSRELGMDSMGEWQWSERGEVAS